MSKFVLIWNRADKQGDIEMGTFATRGEAEAAIPSALDEMIAQCGDDDCKREINAGSWSIVEVSL